MAAFYVSKINFVDWDSIPKSIRNNMYRDYREYRQMYQTFKEGQKNYQGKGYDSPVFTVQTGKY